MDGSYEYQTLRKHIAMQALLFVLSLWIVKYLIHKIYEGFKLQGTPVYKGCIARTSNKMSWVISTEKRCSRKVFQTLREQHLLKDSQEVSVEEQLLISLSLLAIWNK